MVSLLLSKFSISKWDHNKSSIILSFIHDIISSCIFLCERWMNTAMQQFFQGCWLNEVHWANLLLFQREKSLGENVKSAYLKSIFQNSVWLRNYKSANFNNLQKTISLHGHLWLYLRITMDISDLIHIPDSN
jgi:hypothetical protein